MKTVMIMVLAELGSEGGLPILCGYDGEDMPAGIRRRWEKEMEGGKKFLSCELFSKGKESFRLSSGIFDHSSLSRRGEQASLLMKLVSRFVVEKIERGEV